MRTKSLKLDSLPPDLRGVADELLDKKFPEAKKAPGPLTEYPLGRTVEFPFSDPDVLRSYSAFGSDPMATTTYRTRASQSIIDQHSLDRLQRYRGMDNLWQVTLSFGVTPIGTLPTGGYDNYQLIQRLRSESIEVTIGCDQLRNLESYLRGRLNALESLYGGYFYCSLDSEEAHRTDRYYDMPY